MADPTGRNGTPDQPGHVSVGVPGMGPGPSEREIRATIPIAVQRHWRVSREWGYDSLLPYDRAEERERQRQRKEGTGAP